MKKQSGWAPEGLHARAVQKIGVARSLCAIHQELVSRGDSHHARRKSQTAGLRFRVALKLVRDLCYLP